MRANPLAGLPRKDGTQDTEEIRWTDTHTQTRGSQETDGIGPFCSQHSMGTDAVCTETTFPLPWGTCTRNTSRTRVFLRPISVSPFRSSMSEFRSFRIPAQSMLKAKNGKTRTSRGKPPPSTQSPEDLPWEPRRTILTQRCLYRKLPSPRSPPLGGKKA